MIVFRNDSFHIVRAKLVGFNFVLVERVTCAYREVGGTDLPTLVRTF